MSGSLVCLYRLKLRKVLMSVRLILGDNIELSLLIIRLFQTVLMF
jgi:hypothetical protein